MVTGISSARTVPVGEDLTKEELRLSVLRGLASMYRVDKPIAAGVELALGEWGVLNADGKVERAGPVPVAQTYLVFSGTDRFDAHATGNVTLIMSSPIIAKSSMFDDSLSYGVGDDLTVRDLGGGESVLTKAGPGEPVRARVLEVGDGFLVYETMV